MLVVDAWHFLIKTYACSGGANTADFKMEVKYYFQLKNVKNNNLADIITTLGVHGRRAANEAKNWLNEKRILHPSFIFMKYYSDRHKDRNV